MNAGRLGGSRWLTYVLAPVLVGVLAFVLLDYSRPDLLIVGNITVDLVDGTTPTGGAVSYAAVLAKALKAKSCVVTVAGPEADLGVFEGSDLHIIPANETLTFEHTYTWWGHSRRLRVTANPNITITKANIPRRCRRARVVLLGPLTLHDVDAGSFAADEGFWGRLLSYNQVIGLMAQGFQRDLSHDGRVLPLPSPSKRLLAGLGSRVFLFLSDVETDTWTPQQLAAVTASSARTIVTMGEKGALLLTNGNERTRIPAVKVAKAKDTNGAGDTFATTYMVAYMRGDPDPGTTASWAASRAVLQPQTCKPRCAPALIAIPPDGLQPINELERLKWAFWPLLGHLQQTLTPLQPFYREVVLPLLWPVRESAAPFVQHLQRLSAQIEQHLTGLQIMPTQAVAAMSSVLDCGLVRQAAQIVGLGQQVGADSVEAAQAAGPLTPAEQQVAVHTAANAAAAASVATEYDS